MEKGVIKESPSLKIILAVCGSISAYRAYDLMRQLLKNHHEVKVVMTEGSKHFCQQETFYYLGAKEVYRHNDDFKVSDSNIIHIELARWADALVIAPLSANTSASLAAGMSKDLLGSLFLALDQESVAKLFFPAMNTKMLSHPFVKRNLQQLSELPTSFIHPTQSGILACGEEGEGRLSEIEEIVELIETLSFSLKKKDIDRKSFVITTGATMAPLDPVRYLTNPSSGKTGYEIAKKFIGNGHQAVVIAGINATSKLNLLQNHPHFKLIRVTTNQEMKEAVFKYFESCDYYISSAAINDIKFQSNDQKIKKDQMSSELKISQDTDILKEVLKKRTHQKVIGFAAETKLDEDNLKKKWSNKPVDYLIGTKVHSGMGKEVSRQGFEADQADYLLFDGNDFLSRKFSKAQLADHVYQYLKSQSLQV